MRANRRSTSRVRWTIAIAAAVPLSACVGHERQVDPDVLVYVPSQPVQAGVTAPVDAATMDALYWRGPVDGTADGPFDIATGQRILIQSDADGQVRIVVDPASGLPVLLPDRARPADGARSSRVSLPTTMRIGG